MRTARLEGIAVGVAAVLGLAACASGPASGGPADTSTTVAPVDGTYTTTVSGVDRRGDVLELRVGRHELAVDDAAVVHLPDDGDLPAVTWLPVAVDAAPAHPWVVRVRVDHGAVTDLWPPAASVAPR